MSDHFLGTLYGSNYYKGSKIFGVSVGKTLMVYLEKACGIKFLKHFRGWWGWSPGPLLLACLWFEEYI